MPRRPGGSDDDISLFPFLSIVACVIGVLTLMIATVTVQQMGTGDAALISAYEEVDKAVAQELENINQVKKLLDERLGPAAAQLRQQKELKTKELEKLARELEQANQELEKLQKVQIVIPELDPSKRESFASMQEEHKRLIEQVAQLEKSLSDKKEASQSRVTVLPGGSGLNFNPHFVECAEGTLVLHDLDPPKTIRAGEMASDADFLKILTAVAGDVNGTVVFLLRSNGLDTYNAARRLCDSRSIRNGRLPVVGEGKVDLSGIKQALKQNKN